MFVGSHFDATPPQEAAPDSRPSAAGNSSPHGRVAQQDQILFAVMSLLPLLGPDHIRVVSSEVSAGSLYCAQFAVVLHLGSAF